MRETITIEIDRPLSIAEYAAALNRSDKTVRRWIRNAFKGVLNPLTAADIIRLPGAGVLIRADALDRYLGVKEAAEKKARAHASNIQSRLNEDAKNALAKRFGL